MGFPVLQVRARVAPTRAGSGAARLPQVQVALLEYRARNRAARAASAQRPQGRL